jgi:hypothetical protein
MKKTLAIVALAGALAGGAAMTPQGFRQGGDGDRCYQATKELCLAIGHPEPVCEAYAKLEDQQAEIAMQQRQGAAYGALADLLQRQQATGQMNRAPVVVPVVPLR